MRVLVFQHISCEHPGIFRDFMAADQVSWDTVELDRGDPIPPFDSHDALMVMGGPMDVWQKDTHGWLGAEIAAIREWVSDRRRPFLGFCLGHQLLAEALGGEVRPAALPEIGMMTVRLTEAGAKSPLFADCPRDIPCLQWHSSEVTRAPEGAKILASSPACAVNAMSWGGNAYSIQFHVEITPATVAEWGEVPEYADALKRLLGPSALTDLEAEAASHLPALNAVARRLYENFTALARRADLVARGA